MQWRVFTGIWVFVSWGLVFGARPQALVPARMQRPGVWRGYVLTHLRAVGVVGTQSIQRECAGVPSRINNLGTVHDATWAEVRVEASVQEVLHLVERHALVKAALEHLAGCVLGSSAEGSCDG